MKPLPFLAAALCFAPCLALVARAEIKTQTVEYKDGDATLKGFLAYDDAIDSKRPGVLVVPEWWGMTDYPKSRAQQLAQLGYVAFVADIYGDGFSTDDPKVAGQRAGQAKQNDWLRTRGKLALEQLAKNEHVDPRNLAAIGYCFGGGAVLEMARAGDDLKGVVSFHGTLDTDRPAQPGQVKAKILACTGEADPFAPKEKVHAFEQEMKKAGADVKVLTYPNAKHAFTNPRADQHHIEGIAYNKAADEKSWRDMQEFFTDIFGPAAPQKNAK
jgi:dienelactone hydrolase